MRFDLKFENEFLCSEILAQFEFGLFAWLGKEVGSEIQCLDFEACV